MSYINNHLHPADANMYMSMNCWSVYTLYILLFQTRLSMHLIKIQKFVSNGLFSTNPLWTEQKWWSYSDVVTLTIVPRWVGTVLWSENIL